MICVYIYTCTCDVIADVVDEEDDLRGIARSGTVMDLARYIRTPRKAMAARRLFHACMLSWSTHGSYMRKLMDASCLHHIIFHGSTTKASSPWMLYGQVAVMHDVSSTRMSPFMVLNMQPCTCMNMDMHVKHWPQILM